MQVIIEDHCCEKVYWTKGELCDENICQSTWISRPVNTKIQSLYVHHIIISYSELIVSSLDSQTELKVV